ncbi:MAG: hypothetical protein HQM12_11540 [SAR324 cluster bacterium]|nr:hypothetical protein [SAR324 cluster bacterium]
MGLADELSARILTINDQFEEARLLMERTLESRKTRLPAWHPHIADSILSLTQHHYFQANYQQARILLKDAHDILLQSLGAEHPRMAHVWHLQSLIFSNLFLGRGLPPDHTKQAICKKQVDTSGRRNMPSQNMIGMHWRENRLEVAVQRESSVEILVMKNDEPLDYGDSTSMVHQLLELQETLRKTIGNTAKNAVVATSMNLTPLDWLRLQRCGRIAGLNLIRFIPHLSTACLYHVHQNPRKKQTLLCYRREPHGLSMEICSMKPRQNRLPRLLSACCQHFPVVSQCRCQLAVPFAVSLLQL